MSKWMEFIVVTAISFIIPTLVVASNWGSTQTALENLNESMKEVVERVNDTRDIVYELKGKIEK